jgi:hypothetical protein
VLTIVTLTAQRRVGRRTQARGDVRVNRFGKPPAAIAALSALALSISLAAPAGAATSASGGSCRGLAVSVVGLTLGDTNTPQTPCLADSKTVAEKNVSLLLGSVTFTALQSVTKLNGQSAAGIAAARVAAVRVKLLGLELIKATELAAGAGTSVDGCASVGRSTLGAITVFGQQIPFDGSRSVTVKLPLGLGAVYLNQQVKTANSIVQRALFIDLPGTFLDLIVAEASTGCTTEASPQVQSMQIKQHKPSKALVRSVRARIERLRDEPQQRSALTVEQTGH